MTQDYAKKSKTPAQPERGSSGWRLFVTGFLSGVLVTILLGSWWLNPDTDSAGDPAAASSNSSGQRTEPLDLEFFEIFPSIEVPKGEGYGTADDGNSAAYHWIIQAGSFREPELADQRRGELILLGMDATVKPVQIDGTSWHRVEAGPFENSLLRNRAQDKLAEAGIESKPIRIKADADSD